MTDAPTELSVQKRPAQTHSATLEFALSVLGDGVVLTDEGGRAQWCNRAFERLMRRPQVQILGARLDELLPLEQSGKPVPRETHPAQLILKKRSEIAGVYETIRDGQRLVLDLQAQSRTEDKGAVLVVRDVSERARKEEHTRALEVRLRAANSQLDALRTLIGAVRDYAIFMLDPEGGIKTWGTGAERLYGYAAEEVLGKHFSRFYTEEARTRGHPDDELRQAKATGRYEEDGWRIRKDGSRFWANVVIVPVHAPDGQHIGFAKVTRDFSERRMAEARLRALNAQLEATNVELEAFSYSVSHDLRTPLRAIDGFSQALLEDYYEKLDEEGKDSLRRIRNAAQTMGHLIEDLLRLARLSQAELRHEQVDISQLARSIARDLQAHDRQRDVKFVIQDGVVAPGDEGLLRQVLENLLGNAWKFTAKVPQACIELGGSRNDEQVIFFVRDNGAGFDMAYGDRLFGAFQRLHTSAEFSGSGVGLAIVRRIVHRHGGHAWAEGEVGKGATFYVALPELASQQIETRT